jgi:polysaccharide biosynthesis protein PslG
MNFACLEGSIFWMDTHFLNTVKIRVIPFLLVVALLVPALPTGAAKRFEVGIATSGTLLRMNDHDLSARLSDIRSMGATWIRVDFSWPAIQPDQASEYHWGMYDRLVRVADVHNLKILALLAYTPKWAQDPLCAKLVITKQAGQKCNPKSTELFGQFARAAAIRYKDTSVRAWEIWNEPNLSAYWKTVQADRKAVHADPIAYARFANAAAIQIRHHNPDSVILTGGLSPMYEPKYPKGLRQSDFLAEVLPRLRRDVFDGIAMHPYSWPAMPSKAASYNAFYTLDQGDPQHNLRTIITKAGWGSKELWGTEYGASTKGLRHILTPSKMGRPDHVTEASQAQIIAQGIDEWYDKPNVGPLFVHSDSDQWLPHRKNNVSGFGLRRKDGTEKPAYHAFVTATKRIRR